MADALPALLIVEGLRDRYQDLVRGLRAHDDGRLAREFEFIHLDGFESMRTWFARNRGRFVALVLLGVDFSDVADSGKLIGYPDMEFPVPKGFDARQFQGLVIYALMREQDLDTDVPALLVSYEPDTPEAQRYYSFMLYPAQGACEFIHVQPGPEGLATVAARSDRMALRPLDEEDRARWRRMHGMVVGRSRKMVCLARDIERLGPGGSDVLLLGKPGVGKELVANALHRCSPRFVADDPVRCRPSTVNIAALDHNLIEVELFGHERGAFTGSVGEREGVFEYGNGSTVFLDEIGDISQEVQLKLLRTIENRRVKRLGGPREVPVDIRIITATNRTVEDLAVRFRPDFYGRVVRECLSVPSLSERWRNEAAGVVEGDLCELFRFVVEEKNAGKNQPRQLDVDEGAIRFLRQLVVEYIHGENSVFDGNLRTLRSLVEQAWERAQYDGSDMVCIGHILSVVSVLRFMNRRNPARPQKQTIEDIVGSLSLRAIEKQAIIEALARCGNNHSRAADILGIHRDTLRRRITEYEL